jgi:predicted RNA-binding Zn-ribbon protein involved in translation (DUF1610 family)
MSDVAQRCSVCRGLLDEEDLFCANCGTEAPAHQREGAAATQVSTHNFVCQGCGASMRYDASAQTLRCPFCGSDGLEKRDDVKMLRPKLVVPFVIQRPEAEQSMRAWLGRGFWRPGDLASSAAIHKITPVYVPYWIFAATTHTYWTGDTSQTPFGARASWYPIAGEHHGSYQGLLIGASSALTPAETTALCPFDLAKGVPADEVDLNSVVYEQFVVQRKYARPLAQSMLENLERDVCRQYVPGSARNVHVNVKLEGLTSEPVLLPVYIMAYRYKDMLFRFLVNGQTGKATGQAPFSYRKLAAVLGIAAAVILGILLAAGVCGGVMGR